MMIMKMDMGNTRHMKVKVPPLEHLVGHRLLLDVREGHALQQSLDLDHRGHHHLDSIIIVVSILKMSIAPPTHQ